jgi:peptidoglycan hydrolase-like protein with peptidoglycan-binding domain
VNKHDEHFADLVFDHLESPTTAECATRLPAGANTAGAELLLDCFMRRQTEAREMSGALHHMHRRQVNPFKWRVPDPKMPKAPPLRKDGEFAPKTEKALIKYQHKVGLPDDGIAGPEVWEHLFPFWIVNIIVLGASSNGTARPQNPNPNLGQATQPEPPSSPASDRKFIGSPFAKATMDNIAEQLGIQKDKDGRTAIFVMQATWKTEEDPKEIVPGHLGAHRWFAVEYAGWQTWAESASLLSIDPGRDIVRNPS